MAQVDKKIKAPLQPLDTLQEKVVRHALIGVGVAVVSFAVDYGMHIYKKRKKV